MSVSNLVRGSARNSLHSLAAIGAVLLGVLLLAGASGHFVAVWHTVMDEAVALHSRLSLLLPGLILAMTGLVNIVLCKLLWTGTRSALQLALVVNLLASIYIGYLLARGIPGHPIGLFLALVSSCVILLAAIRAGLMWPTTAAESTSDDNG